LGQTWSTNGWWACAGDGPIAASVTLAVGGPWDLLGVLLVLNGGGVAQGYRVVRDEQNRFVGLQRVDPLDILRYDVLITANNADTLATVEAQLLAVAPLVSA
jgi:hypothetical protein